VANKAPILFIFGGLILLILAGFLSWQRFAPIPASVVSPAPAESKFAFPVGLTLPAINIDLPIIPSQVRNGKWEEFPNGISYLLQSPIPGRSGNSVFYGHNWPNLLGKLKDSKENDPLFIRFTDGSEKEFVVRSVTRVLANDVSILENTSDTRVTLYTCIGLFDSHRLVVVAIPKI
jgi:LPXTG-site transpeptidase (sortase) family protein